MTEVKPQILVNGEQQEQGDAAPAAAAGQEQISSDGQDEERLKERETQVKMHSVFKQVRSQIRSQVGAKAAKSSILELIQRVKAMEMEIAQVKGETDDEDVGVEEEKQTGTLIPEGEEETEPQQEEMFAALGKKLEASEKALKEEFEVQISQMRAEMQAYTDQALKDLECKMQSWQNLQQQQPPHQQESKGPERKQRPAAAPTLASRRGRLLTRTMTTIIPKTCDPVIVGPRAKSETLSSSKAESSRLLPRDPLLAQPGTRSRKPLLPPACPPMHPYKKPVRARAKTGL
ncbi:uncharacterized protein V6R79_023166 [Siganus canaliculatus]